jgi:non-ribosomal peptide synthetase component F
MEKSAFAVVAMLAVLKAGGAFVPLDPAHPVARLQEIIGDCAAQVIICSPKHERLCSEVTDMVIPIDMVRLNEMKLKLDRSSSVVQGENNLGLLRGGSTVWSLQRTTLTGVIRESATERPCLRHLHLWNDWEAQRNN